MVLLRPDRLRRAWIFLIPAALYAAWWIWARKFDQEQSAISTSTTSTLIPKTTFYALAAVLGALTGTNPVIPATYTTVSPGSARRWPCSRRWRSPPAPERRSIPRTLWAWLAVLLFYWVTMGAAARPPEGSRYLFFGAVGVLLVAAEAIAGQGRAAGSRPSSSSSPCLPCRPTSPSCAAATRRHPAP